MNRILRCTGTCGIAGFFLTWLLHLVLKDFLRAAAPFMIEGSAVSVCGGIIAALTGLYFSRIIARDALLGIVCFFSVIMVPFIVIIAGISGMIAVQFVLNSCAKWIPLRANQDHDIIPWGYYVMPVLWVIILAAVLCWSYKCHRGASLFNFDQVTTDSAAGPDITVEIRVLSRTIAASVFTSWLIHLKVTRAFYNFWGGLAPIEGAMVILASGIIAAIGFLFFNRLRSRWIPRTALSFLTIFVVGITTGFSGWFGFATAEILLRLGNISYDHDLALYGYYVFPPIWACMLAGTACWYFRATHGGRSLLNFDLPSHPAD